MSYLDRLAECNRVEWSDFKPIVLAGRVLGHIHRSKEELFFEAFDGVESAPDRLGFPEAEALTGTERHRWLTDRFSLLTRDLADRGEVPEPRDEPCAVPPPGVGAECFRIDRVALSWIGACSAGVHVNGLGRVEGQRAMWVAKRAAHLYSFPGVLDTMVGGGIPAGATPLETAVAEGEEEAKLSRSVMEASLAVGAVGFQVQHGHRLRRGIVYCYDLELPEGVKPEAQPEEVECFDLLRLEEVADLVEERQVFKFNCNLVVIDLLLRAGCISNRHPDYYTLVRGIRPALS